VNLLIVHRLAHELEPAYCFECGLHYCSGCNPQGCPQRCHPGATVDLDDRELWSVDERK